MERWNWRVVASFPLQGEHINALEMRSILATMRWRAAKPRGRYIRFCHVADSQVCLAVLVKGRSSSHILNRIVQQVNAITLAANLLPLWAFTASARNPADRPSRWW